MTFTGYGGETKGCIIINENTGAEYKFYFTFLKLKGIAGSTELVSKFYTNDYFYFNNLRFGILASDYGFENHLFFENEKEYTGYVLNVLEIDLADVENYPFEKPTVDGNDDDHHYPTMEDIDNMYDDAFGYDSDNDPEYWDRLQQENKGTIFN